MLGDNDQPALCAIRVSAAEARCGVWESAQRDRLELLASGPIATAAGRKVCTRGKQVAGLLSTRIRRLRGIQRRHGCVHVPRALATGCFRDVSLHESGAVRGHHWIRRRRSSQLRTDTVLTVVHWRAPHDESDPLHMTTMVHAMHRLWSRRSASLFQTANAPSTPSLNHGHPKTTFEKADKRVLPAL